MELIPLTTDTLNPTDSAEKKDKISALSGFQRIGLNSQESFVRLINRCALISVQGALGTEMS
jgi:hypothetical protein